MSKIVGIGANVCDTLLTVSSFPLEDTKLKADSVVLSGGGPCATGLVAASVLGADCAYIGTLTDDNAGKFLAEDLRKFNFSNEFITVKKGFSSFCSYILLSSESGSRTCVFNRGNVPQLKLSDNQIKAICDAEILMVDGNELEAAVEGANIARQNGTKVLYDAGGLYDGVERLLALTDILIPSEEFALNHTGTKNVVQAARILFEKYSPEVVVITCGKKGGIIFDGKTVKEYPAFLVETVDSNGSGDVFHGAYAFAISREFDYYTACVFSSAVSALKCTKVGARRAVPKFEEVEKFLEERGFNV